MLSEEGLRGFVMLLGAHLQGFCRAFYSECVQAVADSLPPGFHLMVQDQFKSGLQLERRNASYDAIKQDFNRFGFDLTASLASDPANKLRTTHLGLMTDWRNHAAHSDLGSPKSGPPTLTLNDLRTWTRSCDELATELDLAL